MQYFILHGVGDFFLKQLMGGKQGYKSKTPTVSIIF